MSYQINETYPEPIVTGYTLEMGGETIATARPGSDIYGVWQVHFGDTGLFAGTINEARARAVLEWIGERLSPLDVINGPEDLDRASVGSVWQSEYPADRHGGNARNQYRLTEGGWEWSNSAMWVSCLGVNNDGPFHAAYPLTAVR